MNIDLSGRHALVCGSSQGIGKAIALELAGLGANVTLLSRNADALNKVRSELHQSGDQLHGIAIADFSDPSHVRDTVVQLADKHTYHILINNTGGPDPGLAIDANGQDFLSAFQMHLVNNQQIVQLLVPGMKSVGYGRVINVISVSVKTPIQGLGVSNTIRGAVASWAKTLSNELGEFGITVNNILPGMTRTARLDNLIAKKAEEAGISISEMESRMKNNIPIKRFADPSETAALAGFLASPSAAYITGTSIRVDGGSTPSI